MKSLGEGDRKRPSDRECVYPLNELNSRGLQRRQRLSCRLLHPNNHSIWTGPRLSSFLRALLRTRTGSGRPCWRSMYELQNQSSTGLSCNMTPPPPPNSKPQKPKPHNIMWSSKYVVSSQEELSVNLRMSLASEDCFSSILDCVAPKPK